MASVTIKGIERLFKKFDNIKQMGELENKVIEATKFVYAQAKTLAPVDTGALAGSIHMDVKRNGDNIQGRVYTNMNYAQYVEFGTGSKGNGTYPYKIKGVSLKYCDKSWVFTPDGGETFYRTTGQVAQPYMYPAIKQNEKYIKSLLKNGVQKEVGK